MIDVTETLSTDNENQLKDVFKINQIQKKCQKHTSSLKFDNNCFNVTRGLIAYVYLLQTITALIEAAILLCSLSLSFFLLEMKAACTQYMHFSVLYVTSDSINSYYILYHTFSMVICMCMPIKKCIIKKGNPSK